MHAVSYLKPSAEEIRRWLLTEGTINYLSNNYSAYICWMKSGAEALLDTNLTPDEFYGICVLVSALIHEGPNQGISALEDPAAVLLKFLNKAEQITPDMRFAEAIKDAQIWLYMAYINSRYEPKA